MFLSVYSVENTGEKKMIVPSLLLEQVSVLPPLLLLPLILVAIAALTFTLRLRRHPRRQVHHVATKRVEKVVREPGKWEPSPYQLPIPPPYPNWSITTTKPLPYRPFRYGPKYHVTMGLRSVSPADWIELDNHYPRFHADKAARLATRADRCVRAAPEAYPAACELLSELAVYLPARYPSVFSRNTTPTGDTITNLWSDETFPISLSQIQASEFDPMTISARLIQDDIALMIERPSGEYHFLAGAIILPGFWRLEDKFGMSLSEIHTSGEVPQFQTKLEKGMMNFFRRLKPEEVVGRSNYFFQVDDNLAWSTSIGSEDGLPEGWSGAGVNSVAERVWFRSERQTLRRLPRTGAVVFTIRTYFHPVTEIADEDYVPGRLASAVRSWGDDVSRYKGREKYGEALLEYLDQKHAEQVARGLDLSREDEVRAYPY